MLQIEAITGFDAAVQTPSTHEGAAEEDLVYLPFTESPTSRQSLMQMTIDEIKTPL